MTQARSYLSSRAFVAVGPSSDYFASDTHYEALAHRIAAALSGGSRFVLVTGDPPANPQVLSKALGNVLGRRYAVIDIPCGPEFSREAFERAAPMLAGPRASGGTALESEWSRFASPLFVFDDFDQLSDGQIEEVYEGTLRADQLRATGVLLARLDFLARLERPALHFLKERIAAHVRVQEAGDDEATHFLHNQLLTQRDRRAEARGFRRGMLIGLAAGGVVLAAGIGAFVLYPTGEQVCEAPASTGQSSSLSEEVSTLRPAAAPMSAAATRGAPDAETTSLIAIAPPPVSPPLSPPAKGEPAVAPPSSTDTPAAAGGSATEIITLLARGDAFLGAGDVTSARLFYERAADAESGLAALELGGTYDPVILGRAGIRGITADPAQALSWYRRARELGVGEADQRIKALETQPHGNLDTRSR